MNKKKIIMIAVLVLFIAVIAIALVSINNKSVQKLGETSQNATNSSTANSTALNTSAQDEGGIASNGVVRKSEGKAQADTNNMVEITDNYFIEQTNDVYLNLDDYIGKTIKMQGLIYTYNDSNGDICYAVVRNTPGCCGNDGLAGLDIRYDGEYPEENTWVEVVGVMGKDTVYNSDVPAIQVASLNETTEGTSFVTN